MKQLSDYFGQNIDQKRIIITGGTTGIGKVTAELLVSLGGRVFIFGRNHEDFDCAINEIKEKYPQGKIYGTTADVTIKEDIQKVLKMVENEIDGVDILINNAALPADGIDESIYEDYKYVIDTNITGYLAFTKEAVSRMRAQNSGHIINMVL